MRSRPALLVVAAVVATASLAVPASGQTPVTAGYRDYSYGTTGSSTPTGEKPECKLWFNDGSWWGSLWNDTVSDYHIYRLDLPSQTWIDTGTTLDPRNRKADAMWDEAGKKLYLASHLFGLNAQPTASNWGRLFRYSYDSATKSYAADAGFPVDITRGNAEALTIAKDSTGRLWATWTQRVAVDGAPTVWVNHSGSDDLTWGAPFELPVETTARGVSPDDISAIVAFDSSVGVMWSNQNTTSTYFAVHRDVDADNVWSQETVVPGSGCSGACTDDLMNLKADAGGRVFASIKTALGDVPGFDPNSPLVMLAVREVDGKWASHTFGRVMDHHTRPILQLDEGNQEVYLFASQPEAGGAIYYKRSSMNEVSFPEGLGTLFIQSPTDLDVNNATSSKQNPTPASGIVVLASEQTTHFYFHNTLALAVPPPKISSFSPQSGTPGTPVTINGRDFTGATGVEFNGSAATFKVVSDGRIDTSVPPGASTGRISVTTPSGTGSSGEDFEVTEEGPAITSFSPTQGPAGTAVRINGSNCTGATGVDFNGTAATVKVVSDGRIDTRVPAGASTGRISVKTPAGTASSSTDFVVTREEPEESAITSFSPAQGPPGAKVTINGSNFTGATGVDFNGTAATFKVVSDGRIDTTVPSGASTGKISVTTPAGTASSSADFVVTTEEPEEGPAIASFSPAQGRPGTKVTIKGSNFTRASAVSFNGTRAKFKVDSSSRIKAEVPSGATTGTIKVVTPAGTAVSAGAFTVTSHPVIVSFSPASGPAGARVTINGSNFSGATRVGFHDVAAKFTVVTDSMIVATVPEITKSKHNLDGKIVVTTPGGDDHSSAKFEFIAPPEIKHFSPHAGKVGTEVDIKGKDLEFATQVTLNGVPCAFTVRHDKELRVVVPAGATTGQIRVVSPAGTTLSDDSFTVKK